MKMSLLLLVAVLCVGSAVSQVKVPCYGEGCTNVTVYLGPRWGSRVIMVPRGQLEPLVINSTVSTSRSDGEVRVSGHRPEEYDETYHRPQHRPVPEDGEVQVDFMDDEGPSPTNQGPSGTTVSHPWWRQNAITTSRLQGFPWWRGTTTSRPQDYPWWRGTTTSRPQDYPWWRGTTTSRPQKYPWWMGTTTSRPQEYPWWRAPESRTIPTNYPPHEVRVWVDKYGRGTVDLSWRGYTGEEVKQALLTLSGDERKQVTKLILDGNRIQYLPVLIFPVEFEYGLQELSLNHNPFNPPYLTRYTRFELSRLGHLYTLNMSRCGLRYIEMPDLPSLVNLDLSYNALTYIPKSLGRLSGLLQLNLRGNSLSFIYNSPFSSLQNLRVLDLGSNGIQNIEGEPFENLDFLVTLKLDNNLLTSVPELRDTGRTNVVYLGNNSFQCTCPLLERLKHSNMLIPDVGSEGSPKKSYATCQSGYDVIMLDELVNHPEIHRDLCDEELWWGARAWGAFALWYVQNPDIMSIIYKVVGVTLIIAVLAVVLRRRRRIMANVTPKGIPYNILDEQQVSTVSGTHCSV